MLAQWLGYRMDNIGFESWEGQQILMSSKSCRLALGPTQFPVQWVPWIFPSGKVAGHYVDHSLHPVPTLTISAATLPLSHMPSRHGQGHLHVYCICWFLLKGWMKHFATSCIWQLYCCNTGILYDEIVLFSLLECIQDYSMLLENDKYLTIRLTHNIIFFKNAWYFQVPM